MQLAVLPVHNKEEQQSAQRLAVIRLSQELRKNLFRSHNPVRIAANYRIYLILSPHQWQRKRAPM